VHSLRSGCVHRNISVAARYLASPAMRAVHDPAAFVFVPRLEAAFADVLAELQALPADAFKPSPDSLTTVADGYDERGWTWYGLFGPGQDFAAHRARCPATTRACENVPGLRNAGFSRFLPGTRLYPHCGEMSGVLRCHLGLEVPVGDAALRFADGTCRWQRGRCLVFDDTFEHEAWNLTTAPRTVLLITFARS
jgi:aspartyl/asparaginyl beta-hydroxylase (cupin superfamily)